MRRLFLRTLVGLHNVVYRLTGGKVAGRVGKASVLLLTVAGRKTGKPHTTPLLYGRDGENLIVIASVGGAPRHPAWYLNLQGQEAEVQVQVGREHTRVRARDAEGEERERLWAQMVELYAPYAAYEQRTPRRIPVVVLEPV
jgi:deazaflavin-dependent oxidoreductase (nitroreductase family)